MVWWTGLATALPRLLFYDSDRSSSYALLYYFLLASSQLTRHRRQSLREQALHPIPNAQDLQLRCRVFSLA
ncbi:hypothetical protein ABF638_32185 (plasmid) [Nostoc sp. CALU 1950]